MITSTGTTVQVTALSPCDIDVLKGYMPPRKARYDAVVEINGRRTWANVCPECWRLYSPSRTLGTGIGQRLVLSGAVRSAARRRA